MRDRSGAKATVGFGAARRVLQTGTLIRISSGFFEALLQNKKNAIEVSAVRIEWGRDP